MGRWQFLEFCRSLGVQISTHTDVVSEADAQRVRQAHANRKNAQPSGGPARASSAGGRAGYSPRSATPSKKASRKAKKQKPDLGSLRALSKHFDLVDDEVALLADRLGLDARDLDWRFGRSTIARARQAIPEVQREHRELLAWYEAGFSAPAANEWRSSGFADLDEAAAWRDAGLTAAQARGWRGTGLSNPRLAANLVARGITAGQVREFVDRGGSSAGAARWLWRGERHGAVWAARLDWCAAGFTPDEADEWHDHAVAPQLARRLSRFGLDPRQAMTLRDRGVAADVLLEYLDSGVGYRKLGSWVDAGVPASEAAAWSREGFDPSDRERWRNLGVFDERVASRWARLVGDPSESASWMEGGERLTPESVAEWRGSEFEPGAVARWRAVGIERASDAARLQGRLRIELVHDLLDSGFRPDELIVWADTNPRRERLQLMLVQAKSEPNRIDRWRRSELPVAAWPEWADVFPDAPRRSVAWRRAALDPREVKRGAQARGVPFVEFGDWLARGRAADDFPGTKSEVASKVPPGTSPKQPAGPLSGSSAKRNRDFEAWLEDGDHWLDSARARRVGGDRLLGELFDRSRTWAPPDEYLFDECSDGWPTVEWLEEVLAHADNVRDRLRRAPIWPVVFQSEDLVVDLTVYGGLALAWVGNERGGLVVSFSTTNFDLWYAEDDLDARFAAGLAVTWFLDCCISLQASPAHPHLEQTAAGTSKHHVRSEPAVYAPRPSFASHVRSLATGRSVAPRAHRVSGHVRRLPPDQTPTEEARAQAPAHVRLTMRSNETFVRSHSRGGADAAAQLVNRLSKCSSLAEALGTAQVF